VQFNQRPDKRRQAEEFVAGARKKWNNRAPWSSASKACDSEVLVGIPLRSQVVDEWEDRVTASDRLQPRKWLFGQRLLDAVDDRLILSGETPTG
jgi:hypothetical protein